MLGQHRSTQRKAPRWANDEARLTADIVELAKRYGRYGYRRITALLRDTGWSVNRKRVERIWRLEGLKVPQRQPIRGRLWLADGSCIRLRPERPGRGAVRAGLLLSLLGVLAVALGTTFGTLWKVPSTTTSVAAVDGRTGAAVTVPGLLEAREGPVVVEATGEGVAGDEQPVGVEPGREPAADGLQLGGDVDAGHGGRAGDDRAGATRGARPAAFL